MAIIFTAHHFIIQQLTSVKDAEKYRWFQQLMNKGDNFLVVVDVNVGVICFFFLIKGVKRNNYVTRRRIHANWYNTLLT